MLEQVKRKLYEVWLEENPEWPDLPWRAQMHNFIGVFSFEEGAKKYVEAVKINRGEKERPVVAVKRS